MRKKISLAKLKTLPPGTDVYYVEEATGNAGRFWIVKSFKRKLLKSIYTEQKLSDIVEKPGYHFEVEV